MRINDPETLAELQALYPQYEAALVNNDVETLTGMFGASPHAMRFGVTENLYGIDGEYAILPELKGVAEYRHQDVFYRKLGEAKNKASDFVMGGADLRHPLKPKS